MKKIDIHCHTTNRPLPHATNPDASIAAISALMQRHQIVHTVLLATYFPAKGTGISNFRLHRWLQGQPHFSMFGSLDFEHYFYQGLNELQELAQLGAIQGIKLYTAYQPIDFEGEKFCRVVELAQTQRLPLMFHGGISYDVWKRLSLADILTLSESDASRVEAVKTPRDFAGLAQKYPDVTFIVSHLCKPFFQPMIQALKQFDNLFTDTSGLLDSQDDQDFRPHCIEIVKRFVGEAGPEKVLFGSDFPVQSHQDTVDFVEGALAQYPTADKELVYAGNARRLIFPGYPHI
ncbi:MAG: amidohydrolase family protein [Chloroflexota bacterium]